MNPLYFDDLRDSRLLLLAPPASRDNVTQRQQRGR
jgi:hypothetical protein